MIVPRESEWFQETDNHHSVVAINETSFYKDDKVGLKTLYEEGKVSLKLITNALHLDHTSFNRAHVAFDFVPFLYAREDAPGIAKIPLDQFLYVELPENK